MDDQEKDKAPGEQGSAPTDIPGTSTRQRTDSESSGPLQEKRPRTKSDRLNEETASAMAASPPKFISMEEIMKAVNGLNNMMLAHEIAVDNDFKLKKLNPPENNLQQAVKKSFHRAFWDVLRKELNETPPQYDMALSLLQEIKENLNSVLLPQHAKVRQEIEEVLDLKLIEQQASTGVLDCPRYIGYIYSIMGKLCAPFRDEQLRKLTECTDIIETFKGIFEFLELMRLDMANFTINVARPIIIANLVQYEKEKFKEVLKIQPDGLAKTRQWLLKNAEEIKSENPDLEVRLLVSKTIERSYLELLNYKIDDTFPETLSLDESRFIEIGDKVRKISITGAVLLVTVSTVVVLQGMNAFKLKLKDHIYTIIKEASLEEDYEKLMPNVAAQIVKEMNECLVEHGFNTVDPQVVTLLEGQIKEVAKPTQTIRNLIRQRINEFLQKTINSSTTSPMQVPPGLNALKDELMVLAGQFLRLVEHNQAVFGEIYYDIIAGTSHQLNQSSSSSCTNPE